MRKKKLRYPLLPQPDWTRTESGKFFPSSGAADGRVRLNIHSYPHDRADYPKNPFWNVVNPTLELSDETILRWFEDVPGTSRADVAEEPPE